MNDIKDIIQKTAIRTNQDEELVEKVLRSMFEDVQHFTSRKEGYCIQVPQVGTFYFRAGAIPNFTDNVKGSLVHWIGRLLTGEKKMLPKTIYAAKENIAKSFYCLKQIALIKNEFITKHSTYRPKLKKYLEEDDSTDIERMDQYIKLIKSQLFTEENTIFSEDDLLDLQP